MQPTLYIHSRDQADAAAQLLSLHGCDAADVARENAKQSRDKGNVVKFCHWRQVAMLVDVWTDMANSGSMH